MAQIVILEYFTRVFQALLCILRERIVLLIGKLILNITVSVVNNIELINDVTTALSLNEIY